MDHDEFDDILVTEKDEARFWRHVEKTDGCWIYHGSYGGSCGKYGRHWAQGKRHGAHRYAYILAYGEIPGDREVCHTCDNPKCVRPDHLWLGTHRENMRDMVRKGRKPRVPNVGATKLSDDQVRDIRNRYNRTGYHTSNLRVLANEFGISYAHAKRLIAGGRRQLIGDSDANFDGNNQGVTKDT